MERVEMGILEFENVSRWIKDVQIFQKYLRLNLKAGFFLGCVDDVDHLLVHVELSLFLVHSLSDLVFYKAKLCWADNVLRLIFNECQWLGQFLNCLNQVRADVLLLMLLSRKWSFWVQPVLCRTYPCRHCTQNSDKGSSYIKKRLKKQTLSALGDPPTSLNG